MLSLHQCWANIRIFEYILILIYKYIYSPKYVVDFRVRNIFKHSFIELFECLHCKYLNISNIYRQIYSFVPIFVRFWGYKYIWIFICQRKITYATHWFEQSQLPAGVTKLSWKMLQSVKLRLLPQDRDLPYIISNK